MLQCGCIVPPTTQAQLIVTALPSWNQSSHGPHELPHGPGDNPSPHQIYDHGDGMFAARLWWMLLLHGHPQPLVLRGGWRRWQQEGRASELYEPCMLKVSGREGRGSSTHSAEVWQITC